MENEKWSVDEFRKHQEEKKLREKKAGKSKYKNKWVEIDGIKFQSNAEGHFYVELKRRQAAGDIKGFERQRRYKFIINDIQVSSYRADFIIQHWNGTEEIVDVKSDMTRGLNDYVIRKKLMMACFGIVIKEVS